LVATFQGGMVKLWLSIRISVWILRRPRKVTGASLKPGRELFTGLKNPEIGNFYFFKIFISNLVSKVLY
jgi:hypothetical protein